MSKKPHADTKLVVVVVGSPDPGSRLSFKLKLPRKWREGPCERVFGLIIEKYNAAKPEHPPLLLGQLVVDTAQGNSVTAEQIVSEALPDGISIRVRPVSALTAEVGSPPPAEAAPPTVTGGLAAAFAAVDRVGGPTSQSRLEPAAAPKPQPITQCSQCGAAPSAGAPLKRCAKCHLVSYCSRECQMAAWRAGHSSECAGSKASKAAAAAAAAAATPPIHPEDFPWDVRDLVRRVDHQLEVFDLPLGGLLVKVWPRRTRSAECAE